ncbi:MAG: MFS transporter [Flavobacteriaceae bacterium]|jgi:DHA2 family multidrug resistance protein-like MFS transporter|nr:MFS transporter [Flavobacteriaceae bacterium]
MVATSTANNENFKGNDRLLFGMIFGVLAFWLFAQTTLNIAPIMKDDLGIETNVMNIAVSVTALFSGIFIVIIGNLADRWGRVRTIKMGFILSIIGSLLVGFSPSGAMAEITLIGGRILQGLSGAFIMPASLALVKAYWDGADRQRAISLWSMGSWGGSGFAALFGGLMAANVGWRWIFIAAALLSLLGMWMIKDTPESKANTNSEYKADIFGIITFMIMMVGLQVVATQGGNFGWTSLLTLSILAVSVLATIVFIRSGLRNPNSFVDFKLFKNITYSGATISNFLLNGTAGILIVAMSLIQLGGRLTAQEAGLLTLGYAIAIVAFIRVGEKLLKRYGPRKPMMWGAIIVLIAILLLMPTHWTLSSYKIAIIIGFTLFGLGLAFYATPSTDVALSALPDDQVGSGSGIYKMASSLGASFGVAISATIFTMFSSDSSSIQWIEGMISYVGRQDNLAVREAAFFAYGFNLLIAIAAIISIALTIPKSQKTKK